MNVNAWKLWSADGKPAPGTELIVATLESVIARDPQHPGANHYYVHTMEASSHPEKAVAAAERLRTMMPAAGHLVHMPAHIMQRVGRYEDAAEANRRGAAADAAYVGLTQPPDYYPVMYSAHNYQFLAASAAMEGRRSEAIAAADGSRRVVSDAMLIAMPGADWYVVEQYTARIRFGLWDEILSMPAPDPRLTGLTGGYLYGRALALAARGRLAEARATLAKLQAWAAAAPADTPAGLNTLKDLLGVGAQVVQAASQSPSSGRTMPSPRSGRPCRARTGWRTTSPTTGSCRCARYWARSCCVPIGPARQKPSIARTSTRIPAMVGRCTV